MALRYASGKINMASIGGAGALTHGLGQTPTEFGLVDTGATHAILIAASAPDATFIYVTATGVAGNASIFVFAAVPHSWML